MGRTNDQGVALYHYSAWLGNHGEVSDAVVALFRLLLFFLFLALHDADELDDVFEAVWVEEDMMES
jgi:hypothetical protein